jgi:hypothetical protein
MMAPDGEKEVAIMKSRLHKRPQSNNHHNRKKEPTPKEENNWRYAVEGSTVTPPATGSQGTSKYSDAADGTTTCRDNDEEKDDKSQTINGKNTNEHSKRNILSSTTNRPSGE